MKEKNNIETLQLLYAGLSADIVNILGRHDLLEIVTAQKQIENNLAARGRVRQFEFTNPVDVFDFYSEVIGFAKWECIARTDGYEFTAKKCKLKDIACALESQQPCELFCIHPITALSAALEPAFEIVAARTLWGSGSCVFITLNKIQSNNQKNKMRSL